MNIISRMFCYPVLERELLARIADRDTQITHLRIEVQELRDRLYMVRGVPVSGQAASSAQGAVIPSYRTGRQRLRDMVKPAVTTLTSEEQAIIDNSLTQ